MTTYTRRFLLPLFLLGVMAQTTIPAHRGLVTDVAGVLGPQTVATLETELRQLEQDTSIEFAVVTVPTLDGASIEEYAQKLFVAWGIGKKDANNGLLFLWAPKERKVRFHVGYGLEPAFPDGRAGQIITDVLAQFRQSHFDAGVLAGTAEAIAVLRHPVVPPVEHHAAAPVTLPWGVMGILGVVCLGAVIAAVAVVRRKERAREEDEQRQEVLDNLRKYRKQDWAANPRQAFIQRTRVLPLVMPVTSAPEPTRRRNDDDDRPTRRRRNDDDDRPSSSSSSGSSSGGSDFNFGGGDSGGGGASGSY